MRIEELSHQSLERTAGTTCVIWGFGFLLSVRNNLVFFFAVIHALRTREHWFYE